MRPKIAKTKRPEAERAAEHYLRHIGCVVTRRALRTKFAKVDFFGTDVIGVRSDGSKIWAQATAGGSEALRARRRKLEAVPWHFSDRVLILQLTSTPDPNRASRKVWWFRVHEYRRNANRDGWLLLAPARVPVEWFQAYKDI